MNIRFSIHYHTHFGQELRLVGSSPELGEWNAQRAPTLEFTPGGHWVLDLELAAEVVGSVTYKYCVIHPGGGVQWEGGNNRQLPADTPRLKTIRVYDAWQTWGAAESALCSDAFTRAILGGPRADARAVASRPAGRLGTRCRFEVLAPRVAPGQQVCVLGSDPALGNWDEDQAVLLGDGAFPTWVGDVRLRNTALPVRYKYGIYEVAEKRVRHWEQGEDRVLWPDVVRKDAGLVVRHDGLFRHDGAPWRGTGVAVPVFALRSAAGLGVGEFADIRLMVDWACEAGIRLIQLLPVNDTVATHTWVDSYPYAAVSVFALHPIYMRLEAMEVLDAETTRRLVEAHRDALNALPTVDYEAVMAVKSRYFKLAYDAERERFLADKDFRAFFAENEAWLVPYAAFSCLRDRFGTSDYNRWPRYQTISAPELAAFTDPSAPHHDDVAVHYFIQFHLHRQLLAAATYARARGVALKGDIPIGVYRHSVDTWVDRQSFNLDSQTGAPPDAFAVDGQNWGFPTYNWDVMARDGFAWWRRRLTHLARYFDAFRIDHILGFFRIWEIPLEQVQGVLGHFSPAFTVSREELNARGIGWDRDRLAQPYIRRPLIESVFREHADWVTQEFLEAAHHGSYRLKPAFQTQRQVELHLAAASGAAPDRAARNEFVKWGLFRLIGDVVLLPDPRAPDGAEFFPRHSMHNTQSFTDLDSHTRDRLNAMYIDYFYKRHEQYWRDQAMVRLPAIRNATNMLICGEDLGMVPDCVPGVMHDLGILSLFIQRMPKDPKQQFCHPADCPYLSVCSPSTHDMSTVRGWWEEDRDQTQRFFNQVMGRWGEAPATAGPDLCRDILVQHLYSPSMWAVIPIQDLLALDEKRRRARPDEERINVPSNPHHYWRYRLHLSLEDLAAATDFNGMLKHLIAQAGRLTDA